MQAKLRNRLVLAFILAFPFAVLLACFLFDHGDIFALPPLPPLPNPNGYTDLVKAGEMVSGTDNYEKMDQSQLRELVSKNAAALALAREALSNQCAVPLQFSTNYMEAHLEGELSGLKRLAQVLIAEGRLAEMENRPADAARSYLDAVHFANESARGGVLIDALVEIAIEHLGTSHLEELAPKLNAATSRQVVTELEALDSQRQTWPNITLQEQTWSRRTFPELRNEFARILEHRILEADFQNAETKFNAQVRRTRQLMMDLAAHAYELEKGRPPVLVSNLVPDYLKTIPLDPLTGANLVFTNQVSPLLDR